MAMRRPVVWLSFAIAVAACGGDDDAGPDAGMVSDGIASGSCAHDVLVGSFEGALQAQFTSVQGQISNGVTPFRVPSEVTTEGACTFYEPPSLFCDPACEVGMTCGPNGVCQAQAEAVSVGVVSVTGMKGDVEMTAQPPVFFYTNLGTLEHPGFDEGDHLVLVAEGEAAVDAFALDAYGVTQIVTAADSVSLETDVPIALSWTAPGVAGSEVVVDLNIAQHGGNPGWIECVVPDTGEFTMPVALTNQLLAAGFSGFPSLVMTRRSIDSIDTAVGCVQWSAQSVEVLQVEIDGLISCSTSEDCPDPQTCQPDLTCG
jgi:hypothetical protein